MNKLIKSYREYWLSIKVFVSSDCVHLLSNALTLSPSYLFCGTARAHEAALMPHVP